MSSAKPWTRVILLTPARPDGCGLSELLQSQFAQRDWFAIEQHNPFDAMAELCLRERTQCSRAAWGLQRIECIALVVHRPDCWDCSQIRELIAAAARYVPSALIHHADDHHVFAIDDDAIDSSGLLDSKPIVTFSNHLEPYPALAEPAEPLSADNGAIETDAPLAKIGPTGAADDVFDEPATPPIVDSRITRQEIEMLLEDDMPSTVRGAFP